MAVLEAIDNYYNIRDIQEALDKYGLVLGCNQCGEERQAVILNETKHPQVTGLDEVLKFNTFEELAGFMRGLEHANELNLEKE